MDNRAFLQDFTNKAVSHCRAALESCRRPHDDVQWKTVANPAPDPSCLLSCGPAVFHHDEQIDIRVGLRFSRSIGTENDNPLRRKFPVELGAFTSQTLRSIRSSFSSTATLERLMRHLLS